MSRQITLTTVTVDLLRKRCLQPTESLMAEVGGVVACKNGRSYAYRNNGHKVLAVAHCDSVTCNSAHFAHDPATNIVFCTRLDDRLGVFTILDVLPALGIPVDVLLTDGEESCQSTAEYFRPRHHRYNWIVEFDRRGSGAATYSYAEMIPLVKRVFGRSGHHHGSYTDICELRHLRVGALNVAVEYEGEHSISSRVDLAAYRKQIAKFTEFWRLFRRRRIVHNPKPKVYSYSTSYGGFHGSQSTDDYYTPARPRGPWSPVQQPDWHWNQELRGYRGPNGETWKFDEGYRYADGSEIPDELTPTFSPFAAVGWRYDSVRGLWVGPQGQEWNNQLRTLTKPAPATTPALPVAARQPFHAADTYYSGNYPSSYHRRLTDGFGMINASEQDD